MCFMHVASGTNGIACLSASNTRCSAATPILCNVRGNNMCRNSGIFGTVSGGFLGVRISNIGVASAARKSSRFGVITSGTRRAIAMASGTKGMARCGVAICGGCVMACSGNSNNSCRGRFGCNRIVAVPAGRVFGSAFHGAKRVLNKDL